jgi:hypothetical protein
VKNLKKPPQKRHLGIHFLFVCLAGIAVSCSHPLKTDGQKPSANRFSEPTSRDRYADDVGRFLAGSPARPGSQFAAQQQRDEWVEHRRELDRRWSKIEDESLPAMRAFQKQELSGISIANFTVFYPFSGPDALMVAIFFPQSPTYVMVGLEPAGTLPTPRQLAGKDLGEYLASVRATIASELSRSFFITRQMDRQFRGQVTDGLVLPILQLLVRTGHTILGFRYVRLDDAGQIVERAADYKAPGKIGNKGVELDFRTDGDQSVHKLFYFSVNLSDDRLRHNRAFLSFLASLKGATTFLKATSYMPHKQEFSTIRERILSNSLAVLQDDSGIPYRFFTPARWRVQLYGDYVRPYGSFRWYQQANLRNAYLTSGPKALGFRIGYGYGRVPSNLQLATTVAVR